MSDDIEKFAPENEAPAPRPLKSIPLVMIDMEEITRRADARRAGFRDWAETHPLSPADLSSGTPGLFETTSLAAWSALAAQAGVPVIPSEEIAVLTQAEIRGLVFGPEEARGLAPGRLDEITAHLLERLEPGYVLRFDPCAPPEVKSSMSEGGTLSDGTFFHEGERILNLSSERLLSICEAYGAPVPVFRRPIVAAETITGHNLFSESGAPGTWPAELRVFVREGVAEGVANYYRQTEMDPERHAAAALQAVEMAQRIAGLLKARGLVPANAEMAPEGSCSFTLDFLVLDGPRGEVILLEGGPEGGRFADPCSFLTIEGKVRPMKGFAFSSRQAPWPLERLETSPAPDA